MRLQSWAVSSARAGPIIILNKETEVAGATEARARKGCSRILLGCCSPPGTGTAVRRPCAHGPGGPGGRPTGRAGRAASGRASGPGGPGGRPSGRTGRAAYRAGRAGGGRAGGRDVRVAASVLHVCVCALQGLEAFFRARLRLHWLICASAPRRQEAGALSRQPRTCPGRTTPSVQSRVARASRRQATARKACHSL